MHGVLAGTGRNNLSLALRLPDIAALYRFLSEDLTGLGITATETFLVAALLSVRAEWRAVDAPAHGGSGRLAVRQAPTNYSTRLLADVLQARRQRPLRTGSRSPRGGGVRQRPRTGAGRRERSDVARRGGRA
ncbi:hypothetical protein [Streptomyces aurantiogriseus]|uniref:Uncharacterized protein n=1 Tax=Streptomyces aurantiogriseus TaxID=66870 RepID=A0A918F454_9ACTN|nr:hypothetical protein [Streptomyces aurantiogriseus]GGR05886.1 hypothetical protein GCM10010251_22010 [Streptomyces aurantiogriseus]